MSDLVVDKVVLFIFNPENFGEKLLHRVLDCRFECLIGLNSWMIELLINGGGPHSF